MTLYRDRYRVESTRLKHWDYAKIGCYFITICTKNRECNFGEIIDGKLQKTKQSEICRACWIDLPNHYPNCILDAFVIMPNHVHMIILLKNNHKTVAVPDPIHVGGTDCVVVETGFKPVSTASPITATGTAIKTYSVSEIVRGFKTFTARKINDFQNTRGKPFWQSRFYDHIIRNRESLERRRKYIINNPSKWEKDRNNVF